jgi:hypothetical protein
MRSHPVENLGNSECAATFSRRLMRLRMTARLLTFWLMEMPTRVGLAICSALSLLCLEEPMDDRRSTTTVRYVDFRRLPLR